METTQVITNYRSAVNLLWQAKLAISRECGDPANDAGFSKLCHASQYIAAEQNKLMAE